MAQVRKLSPDQLQEEFDKIQRAVAFTRGLKRDGSPMPNASSKKLKTGNVEVDVEAPSHGVPQEVEVEAPSQDVSREKEATVEDVEVPSHIGSKSQHTAPSLKKVGTKKKRIGRKGVHTSQSTIPIEEGDPGTEHKLCIKYASDEDSASDCDTPVHLYAVVDWDLLPTGLGSINAIYRLDNSRKYFTSLREILQLGVGLILSGDLKILMDSPEVNDGISGLVIHMFVDKKYPLSINLIERMLDHQLDICHGTVGNELTTAVQLIAFLKKQISDSKRPKVINSPCYHNKELASPEQTATAEGVPKSVAGSSFPAASSTLLPFDVQVQQDYWFSTSGYVVPTGRVVVPTSRHIVPAGKVMAISVISVSLDSSEDSMGTPAGRVILFGTIPTTITDTTPVITPPTTQTDTTVIATEIRIIAPTIPPSLDYTPASPDYSPTSDTEFDPSEDPSSDHIPPLPAISPFLSLADDTTDSDIPDIPPSLTHGTPFTETTLSTQRSLTASGALRRRVMVLARGQPIPHVDYSSLNHFSSDDSSSDSSSSSSSETSLDSLADALSDSASSRSSSDHSFPASPLGMISSHRLCSLVPSVHRSSTISERPSHDSSFVSRSRKRSRSPVASVTLSSPTLGALSYAHPDLLPSPKRIRSPETATDLEDCLEDRLEPYVPREVGLGVDFEDESSEPSRSRGDDLVMDVDVVRSDGIEIDPKIQAEIDECFAYADALRDRGIDARVVLETIDREESKTGTKGPIEVRVERVTHPVMPEDTPDPAQEGVIEAIKGVQREHGRRIIRVESAVTILTERVAELERDNRRLRGTASVESQTVDRLQHDMVRMQRELRTREAVNEQNDRRMAKPLRVCDAVRNLRPLMRDEVEQEEVGGNGNGGNGNEGNGDGGNGNGGNENGGNKN
ncbi:hypothetical protein Tco_1283979 [Tanacetum coccineum]